MIDKIPSLAEFLNEEIVIPASLSTQYMTVKKQIADKENQKNILMKQVNQKDNEIGILTKNLIAIETKAAQMQGKDVVQQQKEATAATEAKAGETTPVQANESLNIGIEELDFSEFAIDENELFNDWEILLNEGLEDEEDEIETEDEDAIEELSSSYVFALRINDSTEDDEIICKVYKNQNEDFWKIRVVKGSEEPLETMQFDPAMDMISIIERIGEIYEEVEEIDMDEYENLLDDKAENDDKYKDES